MQHKPLTVKDLRALIHEGEAKDPLVFLEAVMNGQDPRRLSSIYELVTEIDSFCDGDISKSDWHDIVDLVMNDFRYHTVTLSESITASKTLAEYLHAKRKQIELNGGDPTIISAHDDPLTEEEIMLFKETFNDDF